MTLRQAGYPLRMAGTLGLTISRSRLANQDGISLAGELDHSNVALLYAEVEQFLASCPSTLIIDLTHLDIDSAGVTVFYAIIDRLPAGGWLGVLNPGPGTVRLLEISGLTADPGFRLFQSRREAETALRRSPKGRHSSPDGGPGRT